MDLRSGEAVKQDHAAGQEGTQDQAFAHGPPLPPFLASHGPAESSTAFKKNTQDNHYHRSIHFLTGFPDVLLYLNILCF